MSRLAAALVLLATPAAAHHEVVATASLLPMLGWLAAVTLAGLTAWRRRAGRRGARRAGRAVTGKRGARATPPRTP